MRQSRHVETSADREVHATADREAGATVLCGDRIDSMRQDWPFMRFYAGDDRFVFHGVTGRTTE